MYRMGQKEVDRVARVIRDKNLFRYLAGPKGECLTFEQSYSKYIDVKHVGMTSSGSTALTAVMIGLGLGPGDEVIVPAFTYMATPVAVLGVGAIPVICDIDDSMTLDPRALDKIVGPRTRAVIPVHMWGLPCDMKAIMRVARKHKLFVVEDACQAVGGGFEGRKLGSMGDAGTFSFNFYKNLSCGEAGAFSCHDDAVAWRAHCATDCGRFFWEGRSPEHQQFAHPGTRASEIHAAILNVQLLRLDGMLDAMRAQKKRILKETADTGLVPVRANCLDEECAIGVMYTLPSVAAAAEFEKLTSGKIMGNTGRHVFNDWEPVMTHEGSHHPALNPYKMKENRGCRMKYGKGMCAASIDIVKRTVTVPTHPDFKRADVTARIKQIKKAAEAVL